MKIKPRFWDPENALLSPEKRCPFNSGNTFKDYVEFFFRDQIKFVSPEWRCPMNRGLPGEVPLQSCPEINKTHLQTAAGSTCSLLCSLSLTGYVFFCFVFCFVLFFFTKRLDVIFICKNKNKNMPEELLMGLSSSKPL